MAKGNYKRRHNKFLTRRLYNDGGSMDGSLTGATTAPTPTGGVQPQPSGGASGGGGLGSLLGGMSPLGMLSGAAAGLGQFGGQLLSNGLESKAGGIVSGLGDAVGGIPIIGGFAKGALNLVGGGINALVGSKLNQANINAANADIARLNSASSDATDFDALSGKMTSTAGRAQHDKSFYGKDGLLSNKAKKKRKELEAAAATAEERQQLAMIDNAEAISANQLANLEANYAAFGGPLDFGNGAIGYDFMNRYITSKEALAQGKVPAPFAFGGELGTNGADFTNGMIQINNGGTHEQNPNEGVLFGTDQQGVPNLVEEGEVVFGDYVFSNRIKVPKSVRKRHRLTDNITFADAAKKLSKESEERPNDVISKNGLNFLMGDLMGEQEMVKAKRTRNRYSKGGLLNKYPDGTPNLDRPVDMNDFSYMKELNLAEPIDLEQDAWFQQKIAPLAAAPINPETTIASAGDQTAYASRDDIPLSVIENLDGTKVALQESKQRERRARKKGSRRGFNLGLGLSDLRYVPAIGAAIGVAGDLLGLTNKPDYSAADSILEASNQVVAPEVAFNPIGNYLAYTPFDRNYYINRMGSQAGATRRAILQNAGMNRGAGMAALLAADNNAQTQMGSLARQAEEYNLAQRQQVETFNRGTDQYNSEGMLKADMANAENRTKGANVRLEATIQSAKLRQAAKDASDAARSANLTNLFDSVGNIGWEEYQRNAIESNPALMGYYQDRHGNVGYRSRKNGGFLTIKRGRRK